VPAETVDLSFVQIVQPILTGFKAHGIAAVTANYNQWFYGCLHDRAKSSIPPQQYRRSSRPTSQHSERLAPSLSRRGVTLGIEPRIRHCTLVAQCVAHTPQSASARTQCPDLVALRTRNLGRREPLESVSKQLAAFVTESQLTGPKPI